MRHSKGTTHVVYVHRALLVVRRVRWEREDRRGADDEPMCEARGEELVHERARVRPRDGADDGPLLPLPLIVIGFSPIRLLFLPPLPPFLHPVGRGPAHRAIDGEARMAFHKHPDPDKHARLGHIRLRPARARDLPLEQGQQEVAPARVVPREAAHPAIEAREPPPITVEELGEEELGEPRGVLCGEVDELDEVRGEGGRACDVSEAQAWGEDLAEAVWGCQMGAEGSNGMSADLSTRTTRPSTSRERSDFGSGFSVGGWSAFGVVFGGSYWRK